MKPQNIDRVFKLFEQRYELVPLEIFGDDPYKTLISTLMSARTKDETTLEASNRLFQKAKNLDELGKLDVSVIEELIYPVGFYKTKARNIKKLCQVVTDVFNGEIPNTMEELIKLPGVGRKTANLVMNRAFGQPAIAVDTHVHRITNMLGWVNTYKPEETEKELKKIIPEQYWTDMNRLFVSLGRQFTSKKKLKEFLEEHKLV